MTNDDLPFPDSSPPGVDDVGIAVSILYRYALAHGGLIQIIRPEGDGMIIATSHRPTCKVLREALDCCAVHGERIVQVPRPRFRTTPEGKDCDVCGRMYCDHPWAPEG